MKLSSYIRTILYLLSIPVCSLITPILGQDFTLSALKTHHFATHTDIFTADFKQLKYYKDTETICCALITTEEQTPLDADGMHYVVKTRVQPKNQTHTQTMVLACVHGTWSNHASYATKLEHEVLSFASLLATAHQCPVDIIYYQWSGAPNRDSRKMAGILLSNVLIQDYPNAPIWTVAHSHGCSVVHHASAMLAQKNRSIHTAIHLCAPALDISADMAAIDRIFNFYGTRDMVQIAGSAANKFSFSRIINHDFKRNNLVYNIRIQHDGINTDHFNIKLPLLKNLPWIISLIDTYYPTYGYFDANIFTDTRTPMIAIRDINFRNTTYETIATSLQFSEEQKATFNEQYKRSIHDEHGGTSKEANYEWSAKLVSDLNHRWKTWRTNHT